MSEEITIRPGMTEREWGAAFLRNERRLIDQNINHGEAVRHVEQKEKELEDLREAAQQILFRVEECHNNRERLQYLVSTVVPDPAEELEVEEVPSAPAALQPCSSSEIRFDTDGNLVQVREMLIPVQYIRFKATDTVLLPEGVEEAFETLTPFEHTGLTFQQIVDFSEAHPVYVANVLTALRKTGGMAELLDGSFYFKQLGGTRLVEPRKLRIMAAHLNHLAGVEARTTSCSSVMNWFALAGCSVSKTTANAMLHVMECAQYLARAGKELWIVTDAIKEAGATTRQPTAACHIPNTALYVP